MKMLICKSTSVFKMIKTGIIVALLAACVHCNDFTCTQKEITGAYMEVTTEMISKAKYNIPNCIECPKIQQQKALDCADVFEMGHHKSGIYEIWPINRMIERKTLNVYCDMETNGGGWTVIQRRGDFNTPKDYFYQNWESYKEGFGNIEEDFWLGNDKIFALTNQKHYSVRFDLKDVNQTKKYAYYDKFWIDDENHKYTLHISLYTGDAGDSMKSHDNQRFTTFDKDNDNRERTNCAEEFKGAWWYDSCYDSNLNGLYHKGRYSTYDGISWKTWKGSEESLEWTEIKIRPIHFKAPLS